MGADHNLTAVEMNFLLKEEGFLYGGPGAYGLTAKGEQYANERYVSPGPRSTYVQTTWNPQTTDELDLSDDRKREIRDAVAAARRQKAEQRAADAYDPDAAADGEERSGLDPLLVAAVGAALAAVSAYGIWVVPHLRTLWANKAAPHIERLRNRGNEEPDSEDAPRDDNSGPIALGPAEDPTS